MRNKMDRFDRFDLETEIMSVWSTEQDLDTMLYRLMDSSDGPCSEDDIANMLLGLKELHKSRCLKLWDVFETMIKEKCFVSDNKKE
jgi:hypothetical protein